MLQQRVADFPFTQRVFDVPPHTLFEWFAIIVLAPTQVTVIELGKLIRVSMKSLPVQPENVD